MAARERIATRIAEERLIPRYVERQKFEVKVDGLYGVGPLVEQAFREPVEETVGSAHYCLVIAEHVIGKACSRCEILKVVIEHRVREPGITDKHTPFGAPGATVD